MTGLMFLIVTFRGIDSGVGAGAEGAASGGKSCGSDKPGVTEVWIGKVLAVTLLGVGAVEESRGTSGIAVGTGGLMRCGRGPTVRSRRKAQLAHKRKECCST